jgi:aspartokinase
MKTEIVITTRNVVIFDRPQSADLGFGRRERVAACYRFADSQGRHVEELCEAPTLKSADAELDRALAICERTSADLLTYSLKSLGRDARALEAAGASYGLHVLMVDGHLAGVS